MGLTREHSAGYQSRCMGGGCLLPGALQVGCRGATNGYLVVMLLFDLALRALQLLDQRVLGEISCQPKMPYPPTPLHLFSLCFSLPTGSTPFCTPSLLSQPAPEGSHRETLLLPYLPFPIFRPVPPYTGPTSLPLTDLSHPKAANLAPPRPRPRPLNLLLQGCHALFEVQLQAFV